MGGCGSGWRSRTWRPRPGWASTPTRTGRPRSTYGCSCGPPHPLRPSCSNGGLSVEHLEGVALPRLVAALPGRHAHLVALDIRQYPEGRCPDVGQQPAARVQRGPDPPGRLVMRYAQVEVDPVAMRPGPVHLLEPDRRTLADRVQERVGRAVRSGLGRVTQHRLPERPDRGDVQR